MFAKEFNERGDRDIKFVLSVQGFKWLRCFCREARGCEKVGEWRTAGARIREAGEYDGRWLCHDICIPLVVEGI